MALIVRAESEAIMAAADDLLRGPDGPVYRAARQTALQRWLRRTPSQLEEQGVDLDVSAEPDQASEPNPFVLDAAADSPGWPGPDEPDFAASIRFSPKPSFALKASASASATFSQLPSALASAFVGEDEEPAPAAEDAPPPEAGAVPGVTPPRSKAALAEDVCPVCRVCRICCVCEQTIRGRIALKRAKQLATTTAAPALAADGQPV
eukprot:EG_transcript_21698